MAHDAAALEELRCFDPYDLWCTPVGIWSRRLFYKGRVRGLFVAAGLGVLDWLFPMTSRRLAGAKPRYYPIVLAHVGMRMCQGDGKSERGKILRLLRKTAARGSRTHPEEWAWGLGFPWMNKMGLYGPDVPFITHTPYVMEALLQLRKESSCEDEAGQMFDGTWWFLKRLKVLQSDTEEMASSYAPVAEPRLVVNASSYAAVAYALHALHGRPERREEARTKAMKLLRWVVRRQQKDGSWWYYADTEPGNFIDCFHSCFVIKNIRKTMSMLQWTDEEVDTALRRGWTFLRRHFYDPGPGLCKRFVVRSHRDPFVWDLYDQAEYLGLLVDFGELREARAFTKRVEKTFRRGGHWYCRVDIVGRRWGRGFLRWGIAPYLYQEARRRRAEEKR